MQDIIDILNNEFGGLQADSYPGFSTPFRADQRFILIDIAPNFLQCHTIGQLVYWTGDYYEGWDPLPVEKKPLFNSNMNL